MTQYAIGDDGVAYIVRDHSNLGKKLTIDKAREIRIRYAAGDISQAKLADMYGVTLLSISNVVRGKTYREPNT
jgi:hypothetical protein